MRPVNLFLTEDGVLKLGYYGLTTQSECYSLKIVHCNMFLRFAPEVFEGEYEIKSDVWSLGTALIELMGITPYVKYETDDLPTKAGYYRSQYDDDDIKSEELIDLIVNCFEVVNYRWSANELMDVSVMGWRMMSRIHL